MIMAWPHYLSGVSYNFAGQVTSLTLGNGVVESFGYDSQRMQMTSQTAVKGFHHAAELKLQLSSGGGAERGRQYGGQQRANDGDLTITPR